MAKKTNKTEAAKVMQPQETVAEFEAKIKDLTVDELLAKEQEVIAEADEHQKHASTATFKLPVENKKEVFAQVRMILETMEVGWQYTLGLKEMYEWFMKDEVEDIPYPVLDTVLTTLVQRAYKGYEQWKAAVDISVYFDALREQYGAVRSQLYVDATKHNKLIELLEAKRNESAAMTEVAEVAAE